MLCLSLSHSLTHDLSRRRARGRESERDQRQTDRNRRKEKKDTHNNTATQCSKCMDHQTRKAEKEKQTTKKPTETTLGFRLTQELFDTHASICTKDTKSSLLFLSFFFFLIFFFLCLRLFLLLSPGVFVLVPVSLFFFFLSGPKNRQKNDNTVF